MLLPEMYPGLTINPRSAAHRATQDLVVLKNVENYSVHRKTCLHLVWVLWCSCQAVEMVKLSGKWKNTRKFRQYLNFYNDSLNVSAIKKAFYAIMHQTWGHSGRVVGLLKTGFPRAFQPCRPPPWLLGDCRGSPIVATLCEHIPTRGSSSDSLLSVKGSSTGSRQLDFCAR